MKKQQFATTGRDIAAKMGWPNVSNPGENPVLRSAVKVYWDYNTLMNTTYAQRRQYNSRRDQALLAAKQKRRNVSTLPTIRKP